MTEGIIIAIIGLIGSAIGSMCGVIISSKLTQYRLEQLEKKVQAHNNLVERMYDLEGRQDVLKEDIRVIGDRITTIESRIYG